FEPSAARRRRTDQHTQSRGLAGPVRPEDAEALATIDAEVDRIDYRPAFVDLRQSARSYYRAAVLAHDRFQDKVCARTQSQRWGCLRRHEFRIGDGLLRKVIHLPPLGCRREPSS